MTERGDERPGYPDGRPAATLRMEARDNGVALRHGDGPDRCDAYGARDVWVYEDGGTYYMHYDAAGERGWLCALATSPDGLAWATHGPVLDLGQPGEDDAGSASYGVTYRDGDAWHMFYLGTPNVSPLPDRVPSPPYNTMKARAASPRGPWRKQPAVAPLRPQAGTYYSATASPGHVIRHGGEYLMFFSPAAYVFGDEGLYHGRDNLLQYSGVARAPSGRELRPTGFKRTLGIARTPDLDGPWTPDPEPIVPRDEQIENSSLYYEQGIDTWFLFTNHVGVAPAGRGDGEQEQLAEYTDAVWVYWSRDPTHWDPAAKAVVLDARNCTWSPRVVGLPSVLRIGDRLALYYDGFAGDSMWHMGRDIGLAWLDLPLTIPLAP